MKEVFTLAKRLTTKDKNELLKTEGKQILHYGLVLRIHPNELQSILINKTFGCSRLIYNKYLADRKDYFKIHKGNLKATKYQLEVLTPLKQSDVFSFLREVDKFSLEASLQNVEDAYKRFFKHQNKFPKFKSKRDTKKTYTTKFTNDNIKVDLKKGVVQLPKLKEVPFAVPKTNKNNSKVLNLSKETTKITKAVVSLKGDKYYVSLTIEEIVPIVKKQDLQSIDKSKILGIDLGLKDFLIASNGEETFKIDNPKYLRKSEKKLKKLQRRLSKKVEGSKNFLKAKQKLNKLHTEITNQRHDFAHQLSRRLVNENQVIIVEDLNIKGMVKNKRLAKSISDAGWYKFIIFLNYKLEWEGKNLIKVNRFFASSKICSHCGSKNIMLTLSDRKWTCNSCNTEHDRDENASQNIRKEGIRLLYSA